MHLSRILLPVALCLVLCAPPTRAALLLDADFDGLHVDGTVTTDLLGPMQSIRWTPAGTYDCFVMVDPEILSGLGATLLDANGEPLSGLTIVRGGLGVSEATGTTRFDDGWSLLAHFDSNRDGRIDETDDLWAAITLFMDEDADGRTTNPELHRPETALISMPTSGGDPFVDEVGNRRTDTTFLGANGETAPMTDVEFARVATNAPGPAAARRLTAVSAAPNPFNPRTVVGFTLHRTGDVRVDVFDERGRRVATPLRERRAAGRHEVIWRGVDAGGGALASGLYLVRVSTGGEAVVEKVGLVR